MFREFFSNKSSDDNIPYVSAVALTDDETEELEDARLIFQHQIGLESEVSPVPPYPSDPPDWDETPSISQTDSFETISSATSGGSRTSRKKGTKKPPKQGALRQQEPRSPKLSPKASVQQMAKSLGPGGIPLTTEEEGEDGEWDDDKSTLSSQQQQSTSKNARNRFGPVPSSSSRQTSRPTSRHGVNETMMASMPVQHVGFPKREITRIDDTEDPANEASQSSSSRGGTHGSAVTHATQGSTGTYGSTAAVTSLRFGVVTPPDGSSNTSSSYQVNPNNGVPKRVTRSPSTEQHLRSLPSSPTPNRRPTYIGRGVLAPSRNSYNSPANPASPNSNPARSPSPRPSPVIELPSSLDEVYSQYDSEQYGYFYKASTAFFAVYALVIYLLEALYSNAVHKCGKGDKCDNLYTMWLGFFNVLILVLSIPLNIISLCLNACVIGFSSIIVLVFDGIEVLLVHPLGLVIIAFFVYTELAIYF